ncbi:hypothetical protein D5086_017818 [Populus alba]|uniref:Uncharacterized protein n=1 Tax=Populus alba TaxID=43335 RepID=A0ACC4BN14_POPAL
MDRGRTQLDIADGLVPSLQITGLTDSFTAGCFLMGLKKYGKGDWRNISRNFVISRTPTRWLVTHKVFIRSYQEWKQDHGFRCNLRSDYLPSWIENGWFFNPWLSGGGLTKWGTGNRVSLGSCFRRATPESAAALESEKRTASSRWGGWGVGGLVDSHRGSALSAWKVQTHSTLRIDDRKIMPRVMPANYQQEEQSEIHLKISRTGTWHLARLAGVKSQACCLVAIDTTIAISSCFNGANMVKP